MIVPRCRQHRHQPCPAVAVPSSDSLLQRALPCTTLDVISYLAREGPIKAAHKLESPATV